MTDSHARTHGDEAESSRAPRAPRLWQRAVPVTALAVAAAGLTLAFANDADEVELSTSRIEQPFVELALTNDVSRVCGTRTAQVRFFLTSHLAAAEQLTWRVAVDPAGRRTPKVRATKTLMLDRGQTEAFAVKVKAPRRGEYDVTVRLADRPEVLRVHCDGAR